MRPNWEKPEGRTSVYPVWRSDIDEQLKTKYVRILLEINLKKMYEERNFVHLIIV